jgi:integrase/recombinase XerD
MNNETFTFALHTFENRMVLQRYALNTIKSYLANASVFLKYFNTDPQIISIKQIEDYINLKVHQNISVSHQKSLVGAIKKFYELVYNKFINLQFLNPKRGQYKIPTFFSKQEVKKILDATDNIKHKAILTTIYACGLRLSELLNLKIHDVKSDSNVIIIRQAKGNKDRIVNLPKKLLVLLREYYKIYKPSIYLFEGQNYNQYSPRSVQIILKNSRKKANILTPGTVHTLRHSYATHLINAGVDIRTVQNLLGHQSLKTTQIYTHITDHQKQNTISPLDLL